VCCNEKRVAVYVCCSVCVLQCMCVAVSGDAVYVCCSECVVMNRVLQCIGGGATSIYALVVMYI